METTTIAGVQVSRIGLGTWEIGGTEWGAVPDDVAIAYNNRCFAYMKLGKLKEALDDCNNSLKYGRLPDALQKQQQLVKLLSAQTT